MTDTEHQEMKRAFAGAIRHAIERMGAAQFRKCSFFGASRGKDNG